MLQFESTQASLRAASSFFSQTEIPRLCCALSFDDSDGDNRVQKMLDEFNESWLKYWASYVELQNQLYQSARAAREVSWLAATDEIRLSQINRTQRELYAT